VATSVKEAQSTVDSGQARASSGPSPWGLPKPKPPSAAAVIRRFFLGDPLSTSRLKEERLGKASALAIFASDMLSSVAYATEEMLRILVPALGLAAFGYVMPLSSIIAALLFILLFSYRQTIKEYPTAGGAYSVSRDNFGDLTAQVAGYALLTDYIMTVAVSSAAGVLALTSFLPSLHPFRVYIAVSFVIVIAWGNLRGVRESGRMFSLPAYLFIVTVGILILTGLARLAMGDFHPIAAVAGSESGGAEEGAITAAGIFLVLRAFASGGAAATGIEAVSNGVSAFKPPEWKHARETLTWIVIIVVGLFTGIGILATALKPIPDPHEKTSVLAMIAQAVFGQGAVGKAMFAMVQLATMLVLIFAANTSFADFPRLASLEAADSFLPRAFTKRGYRLNFSTGILFLAGAASGLLILFQASVTRLIPLYAVGVFTSITLSQAGMAKHHLTKKQSGWRKGLIINASGAATTAVVAVIIGVTKFTRGGWAVMVLAPFFIALTIRVNRHYRMERQASGVSKEDLQTLSPRQHVAVVLAEAIDAKLIRALEFAHTVHPDRLVCIHLADDSDSSKAFVDEWNSIGPEFGLQSLLCRGDRVSEAVRYVRSIAMEPDTLVTVVVPAPFKPAWYTRFARGPLGYRISKALRRAENVNVCVVRELPGAFPETSYSGDKFRFRISPRPAYRAIIAVDKVDKALVKAIRYAKAIKPFELECVHIAVDPGYAADLVDEWIDKEITEPLEVVGCEDRDIARSFYNYLAAKAWNPRYAVMLIIPRRDFPKRWHVLLHDRTRRKIARGVASLRNVYLVSVPYYLGGPAESGSPSKSRPAHELAAQQPSAATL
jgi:amino acid transporter